VVVVTVSRFGVALANQGQTIVFSVRKVEGSTLAHSQLSCCAPAPAFDLLQILKSLTRTTSTLS